MGCGAGNRTQHVKKWINRFSRWMPAPLGVLKVNTYGSSRGNPGHAGIGGIGRDDVCCAIFFFSIYKGQHSNNLMEPLAIKFAIEFGYSLGWRRIMCQSNSQIVVDMLNIQDLGDASWKLAYVVRQILHLCNSFNFVSFCHIPKEIAIVGS